MTTLTIQSVPISDIVIDANTDFRTQGEDVGELAKSIEEFGLIQPITIAPGKEGGFEVVAGRRRLRAYVELGRTDIEAIIRDDMDTDQSRVVAQIIENLQREDVSILDEARAFAQLGEYGMKQKDVATACGVSPAHVSGRLALLKLHPDLIKRVEDGKLPQSLAVKIARLPKAVRDELGTGPISEFDVSRAERKHEETKAVEKLMKEIAEATGVPTGARLPGGSYESTETMAENIGLTDEDKPKSHDWDIAGRVHRSDFESDEEFLSALVEAKPKGFYVTGAGRHAVVVLIDSANLDKARKQEQEEQRRFAEEREAAAAKVREDFNASLAPLIDSPDKSAVLAYLLMQEVEDAVSTYYAPALLQACERLGIDTTGVEEIEDLSQLLRTYAGSNTTNAIRVLLACQVHVTELLIHLGFLDTYPTEHLPVHAQLNYYREGKLPRERLTADAEVRLSDEEAADAEDDEFQAKVQEAVHAEMDRLCEQEDHDEEFSEEEVEAITETVTAALAAEDEEE